LVRDRQPPRSLKAEKRVRGRGRGREELINSRARRSLSVFSEILAMNEKSEKESGGLEFDTESSGASDATKTKKRANEKDRVKRIRRSSLW